MGKKTQGIIGAAGVLLLSACHSANLYSSDANGTAAQIVTAQSDCMLGKKPFAQWIATQDELSSWWQRIHQLQLPQPTLPNLNISANALILIYMGQKTSGGYALSLANKPVKRQDDVASVHLEWKQPQAGMLQTQMLSSPCILLQLPASKIQQVNIVDQDDKIRFSLSRPS